MTQMVRQPGSHARLDLRVPPKISAPAAQSAHVHLLEQAAAMNLRAEPHTSALSAIKLYDRKDRYLFSWIINSHHLLFFIRKPALKLAPHLLRTAEERLKGVKVNPAGEVTVRIEAVADAEALTRWLFNPSTWTGATLDEHAREHSASSSRDQSGLGSADSISGRKLIK